MSNPPPIPSDKKALAAALLARKAKRGRPIPNEKRIAILGLYLQGELSMADIAIRVGVSGPTVTKVIDQAIADGTEADDEEPKANGRKKNHKG